MSIPEGPDPAASVDLEGTESTGSHAAPAGLLVTVEAASVIEHLNDAVVVAGRDGCVVELNPAAERLIGWDRDSLIGEALAKLVPERLRDAHGAGFARVAAGAEPVLRGKPLRLPALRPDGSEVPVEMITSSLLTPAGERLVVGTLRPSGERLDLERRGHIAAPLLEVLADSQPAVDLELRLLETLGATLEFDWCALWQLIDGALRCRHVWRRPGQDDAALDDFESATRTLILRTAEGLPGRVLALATALWIPDLSAEPLVVRRVEADRAGLRSGFAFPVVAEGRVVSVIEMFGREQRQPDAGLLDSIVTVGARLGEILLRHEEDIERQRVLSELEASRRLHEFLLRAVGTLAEAVDYRQTLERLARVAVPALGDICLIDVVDEDGKLVRMAGRHGEPMLQHLVDELKSRYPPDPFGQHPSVRVIRTGESSWSPEMSDEFLGLTSRDEHHFDLVKSLGFSSYMTVPLATPTKVLGAVTLVTTRAGRRFSESDLAIAEQLASQITAVVDNARVHESEHRTALALQRSLLPDRLPDLPNAVVAARYLPGSDDAEVGGDWYDVLCLSGDRIGLVAGDVQGHDIEAASVMGQLRNALRAYALEGHEPAEALVRLARFADLVGLERMATVVLAVLDPYSGELTVASAGHPQPIVISRSGSAAVMTFPSDPPVGVGSGPYRQYTTVLEQAATVMVYTDGLVEGRAVGIDESLRHLLATVQAVGTDPEAICGAIEQLALAEGGHTDDVAVLAFQWLTEGSDPGAGGADSEVATGGPPGATQSSGYIGTEEGQEGVSEKAGT